MSTNRANAAMSEQLSVVLDELVTKILLEKPDDPLAFAAHHFARQPVATAYDDFRRDNVSALFKAHPRDEVAE